jgi:hypothetical protein
MPVTFAENISVDKLKEFNDWVLLFISLLFHLHYVGMQQDILEQG